MKTLGVIVYRARNSNLIIMSKKAKMDEQVAEELMSHMSPFVNADDYDLVNEGTAIPKKIIEAILKVVYDKFETRHNLTKDDFKISFDSLARQQLLFVMKLFYTSSFNNKFEYEEDPSNHAKKFDAGSLEHQLWTWFSGIITGQDWEMFSELCEVPKEIEEVSLLYSKRETSEDDEVKMLEPYRFAQSCFMIMIERLVDIVADLYWDPCETGPKSGVVIKGAILSGIFRLMNSASGNPEIFKVVYESAGAFSIVKKSWVEEAKAKTKAEKDAEKEAKKLKKKTEKKDKK